MAEAFAGGMSVRRVIDVVRRRLADAGVPSPEVDAELLVCHVSGWSRSRLARDAGATFDTALRDRLDALVQRREAREPLQLLIGTVGFRYLTLDVAPGVFIPRPETEVLAGEAIDRVPPGGVVVEPCTGSGAVACAVSLESAAELVIATDTSDAAVDLARRNVEKTGAKVRVAQGDLLAPVPSDLRGRIDVLVSNPPYLCTADLDGREPEVVAWDPVEALVSGPTGHEVTDRLLDHAAGWLRPGGWVLLEVDSTRAGEVAARAAAMGLIDAAILRDLTGADRIVAARRRP